MSSYATAERLDELNNGQRPPLVNYGKMIGGSARMKAMFDMIEKAARLDVPVLITGETGTGKELVAGEIQARSARCDKPFVVVNTGALSTDLVTSELFGHMKGAFTGAIDTKIGRIAEAKGGTLFLDEIATMEERTQVALLRVLENRAYRPIGGKQDEEAEFRLIAATNVDLNEAVEQGRFRDDLLYRLQVFQIGVPPLRKRKEDIPMLAYHFLAMFAEELDLNVTGISDDVLRIFEWYAWPGNIREFKNVIAQAVVLAETGDIETRHLPSRIVDAAEGQSGAQRDSESTALPFSLIAKTGGTKQSDMARLADTNHADPADGSADSGDARDGVFFPLGATLEELQQVYVMKTLAYCAYNKTRTAKKLGLSRKTLYDKLTRWEKAGALPNSHPSM